MLLEEDQTWRTPEERTPASVPLGKILWETVVEKGSYSSVTNKKGGFSRTRELFRGTSFRLYYLLSYLSLLLPLRKKGSLCELCTFFLLFFLPRLIALFLCIFGSTSLRAWMHCGIMHGAKQQHAEKELKGYLSQSKCTNWQQYSFLLSLMPNRQAIWFRPDLCLGDGEGTILPTSKKTGEVGTASFLSQTGGEGIGQKAVSDTKRQL